MKASELRFQQLLDGKPQYRVASIPANLQLG